MVNCHPTHGIRHTKATSSFIFSNEFSLPNSSFLLERATAQRETEGIRKPNVDYMFTLPSLFHMSHPDDDHVVHVPTMVDGASRPGHRGDSSSTLALCVMRSTSFHVNPKSARVCKYRHTVFSFPAPSVMDT